MTDFDFDQWVHIFATDLPEAKFRRKLMFQEELKSASPEHQVLGANLIERLNAIHITCTPIVAAQKSFDMMCERAELLGELFDNTLKKEVNKLDGHYKSLGQLI